ncbi:MAG: M14 family metallopeptidase, partial [Candidatus Aminicenantales bacterium]
MLKKTVLAGLIVLSLVSAVSAESETLSRLFLPGYGLKDTDGDGLADRVALTIVVPDDPTVAEIVLAADIAARANLESLAQDPALVKREAEISDFASVENPILIGTRLKWLKRAGKDGTFIIPSLRPEQGFVGIFQSKMQNGILLTAGSEEALLQAGRAFFLRWPYLWDIWGRETGSTYEGCERDLSGFLREKGVSWKTAVVRSILYDFPDLKSGPGALKKLAFNAGEIKDLGLDVDFSDKENQDRAFQALEGLRSEHGRGQKTGVLSYPGCASLVISLRCGSVRQTIAVPRPGQPKRMLTPAFKNAPRTDGAGREFDLLNIFTTKGIYGDLNEDGIPDTIDGRIVVPAAEAVPAVARLASRLILQTAGAMFPLVYMDTEIEFRKNIVAPILVGDNALTAELRRLGKIAPMPAAPPASGIIRAVPRAFNKSSALVVTGADPAGLEKTLGYFGTTFPYFDEARSGQLQLSDAAADIDRFFKGEKGAAEAQFALGLKTSLESLKDKDLESFKADLLLPKANPAFMEELKKTAAAAIKAPGLDVRPDIVRGSKRIFEKEQAFAWEADTAAARVKEKLALLADKGPGPVRISIGVSESPESRARLKARIEAEAREILAIAPEVEVLSAYKQGFFWIVEKAIPALKGKPVAGLTIKFAEARDDFAKPKRFYTESTRWLQELYPVDEILSRDLGLAPDAVQFEMIAPGGPTYEIQARDGRNNILWTGTFSPRVREIPYLKPMPEWGTAQVTTGWVRIERGAETVLDDALPTDLERVWSFFQDEGLIPVYNHVLKKTGGIPTFSKQPYFKQLKIEVWASEPDARLGLDEEIVSSLEALHDEIYFDTLDFLRGLTDLDAEAAGTLEDTSRFSAPGNVFPVIHPSTEGAAPKIKITFEDWPATAPSLTLTWKERGRDEMSRTIAFQELKPKSLSLPALVYDGREEKIDRLIFDLEIEKETDYVALLDLLGSYRDLQSRGALADPLSFPRLGRIAFSVRCGDIAREETIPVSPPAEHLFPPPLPPLSPGTPLVDTSRILSPEMVEETVARLAGFPVLNAFIAGRSYENRRIPVIEATLPAGPNVSVPRLISFKPTLYLSGRQHANEVSSTNYILKLAELLATDPATRDYVRKINFVLHPMENPDGAALAYDLQALTPFHSLHAGRYSALGLEIGNMTGSPRPILPEAAVKRDLMAKWFPDIALNLHGYPSHEWVQQFSNYSPYLFREYWIPKGWFAYVPGVTLPIYDRYKTAGEEIRQFIIAEMNADPGIKESNLKFYDRYRRWAARWQPHLDYLEIDGGVNLFSAR